MDHLTALKVFRHIVEGGSFAEAARRLGLSAAAISKNIAALETHLNARLFHRTTRKMSLTEAGETYMAHIPAILEALEEADRALAPLNSKPGGKLRIAAPMTFGLLSLSKSLPRFLNLYPDISVDLDLNDRRVDLVRDGYDLALRGQSDREQSGLITRKLATSRHVLCASPAYLATHGRPRHPDDLRQHNCIRFSLSSNADIWHFRQGNIHAHIPVKGRYSVTSSLAVREALLAGCGINLIPLLYVQDDIQSGRLCTLLDDWQMPDLTLYATYPSRRHMPPKLRVFLDFAINEMKQYDCPPS